MSCSGLSVCACQIGENPETPVGLMGIAFVGTWIGAGVSIFVVFGLVCVQEKPESEICLIVYRY